METLRERMAYLRKPDGLKRGKPTSNEETTPKLKKPHYQMPATSYVIPLEQGEDKASHDRHVKALQQECKTSRPNKQVRYCIMCKALNCSMDNNNCYYMYVCVLIYPHVYRLLRA